MKFTDVLKVVTSRAREPSTWAAIAAILTVGGVNPAVVAALSELVRLAPDLVQALSALGALGAGTAGIALREGGGQ